MPQVSDHPLGERARRASDGALTLCGWLRRGYLWLLALALGTCGHATSLDGSLKEILDLHFDSVEVSTTTSDIAVTYYRPNGDGRDVVLKVVGYTKPEDVVPGLPIDLAPAPDGAARGAVTRAVANDSIRTLAAIKRGSLTFDRPLEVGKPVSGNFRVTLGEGGDAGRGRTAFGDFTTPRVVPGS